ncbi:MAG: electron transfer flavoprotein alpha/ beta subunit [SAR202 cluster bacterium]|nr:electron transfer flavoprotein alpha/ beta subunit [SAR202 cluster bacterium]
MKIAVCVKYVPVVARMRFDYQRKTIIREGVPSEVNPFDLLGLVRAVQLKQSPQDQVVAVCMGPPQAKEGLVQCLALGADRAVLITDRALAGSDTLATARALSLALQRESPDLIICGRNSADAETGQVGPELAELLGLPHVSQVRKLDYQPASNAITAERVTDEGYQVVECPLPAVVCVTEGIAPETFPNRQQVAEVQSKPSQELTAAQLSSDTSIFGLAGSPTYVESIRLVEPSRLGVVINQDDPVAAAQQVAGLLRERLASLGHQSAGAALASPRHRYPNQRSQAIWVVAETSAGGLRPVTRELLGKARQLSETTRSEVAALLIGSRRQDLVAELTAYGADRVLALENSRLEPVASRAVAQAVAAALAREKPYAVLFAATADGRDLASRVAARLGLGLTGDAVDLEINPQGQLVQFKPALGGNVVAPILSKTLPNLATLREGLLTPIVPDHAARVVVEDLPATPFSGADVRLISEHRQEDLGALALAQAQVVVGVGKGIGGPEHLAKVRELAESLGATLCTTRDVVHLGWLPHQVQVGISGRAIAPKVYLAVGIRGAFNHTVGVQKAGVIIAINTNQRHPIFKAADYGIVGDWQKYLPPLAEALRGVVER